MAKKLSKVKLQLLQNAREEQAVIAKPMRDSLYAALDELHAAGLIALRVMSYEVRYKLTDAGRAALAEPPAAAEGGGDG